MNRRSFIVGGLLALALLGGAAAAEPADGPVTPSSPHSAYESIAIRPGRGSDAGARAGGAPASLDSGYGTGRVVLSLAVVIAAIFGMKWAGKRFFGIQSGPGGSGAIQILSRTLVAPRQQLMLVKVGRRVLVVANAGSQMNTLSEIRDAEEVAELVGQASRKTSASAGSFAALFGGADAAYRDDGTRAAAELEADEAAPEVEDGESLGDPALADTRQEIGGLMQKVRALSRAYGKQAR